MSENPHFNGQDPRKSDLFEGPHWDGKVLDEELASHGYQRWTATVGTIIEAQARGLDQAVMIVHQFKPADLAVAAAGGDQRNWQMALDRQRQGL